MWTIKGSSAGRSLARKIFLTASSLRACDEPSGADDGRGAGDMLFGSGEDLCAHGLYYTQTSPGPYTFASQLLAKANSPDEVWPGGAWSADLHLPVAEADTADLDASVSP
jgi:hypothetical protein